MPSGGHHKIETIYADGEVTVYLGKIYKREDFTDLYWKHVCQTGKVMSKHNHRFNPSTDGLYKVKVSSDFLGSDDLTEKYGHYKGRHCKIATPYVIKNILDYVPEGGDTYIRFTAFRDYVTPEDESSFYDTARIILNCKVHYVHGKKP